MLGAKVFVAGHAGMVGGALIHALRQIGAGEVVVRSKSELDLRNQSAVNDFFKDVKPDYVIVAAAKVGGIKANNTYRAEFIYDNLMIGANVIDAARCIGVERLVFLGSSCIYPKHANQPIKEDALLTGALEYTNEPYAIAKIAGLKLCENYNIQYGTDFRCLMPCNLFGPGDNYSVEDGHVIPALIARMHDAKIKGEKSVKVWGSGKALREFLFVTDLADACIKLLKADRALLGNISVLNVGSGEEISIENLAIKIAEVVEYPGNIVFDDSMPEGTPRKVLDSTIVRSLGWSPRINLSDGLRLAYSDFLSRRNI